MKPTTQPRFETRPARRRGVTLIEMLVTVAMLVIIMTILVQVFQAATGALTAAQTVQQLDDELKLLDSTIRSDLAGATAKFTPPLDPSQNLGYFEYGENEFADIQGEDSDDYIRFTAKAPPGRPFTGRMWVTTPPANTNEGSQFYNGQHPAGDRHQSICRDHLFPAQRQPLSPRAAGRPGAAIGDRSGLERSAPLPISVFFGMARAVLTGAGIQFMPSAFGTARP